LDLHANPRLDLTSLDILLELLAEARRVGVELRFCEVAAPVRDLFLRSGLLAAMGEARLFHTLDEAVQDFLHHRLLSAEEVEKY
jgi:anti-anti-sigma regulatory factor